MDLHLTAAQPSSEEKAAVDTVVGVAEARPEQGAELESTGASKRAARETRIGFDGQPGRSKRYLLLPVLHAIQEHIGWISPGALNYASMRLGVPPAEAHGVASFYEMFSLAPRPPVTLRVCDDIACMTRGAGALCTEIERKLGPAGKSCAGGKAIWQRSACLGLCERAPAALPSVLIESSQLGPIGPEPFVSSSRHRARKSRGLNPIMVRVCFLATPQLLLPFLVYLASKFSSQARRSLTHAPWNLTMPREKPRPCIAATQ